MNIPLDNDWYKRAWSDRRYTKFLTVDQWFKCCTTIIYNEIYNKHQCLILRVKQISWCKIYKNIWIPINPKLSTLSNNTWPRFDLFHRNIWDKNQRCCVLKTEMVFVSSMSFVCILREICQPLFIIPSNTTHYLTQPLMFII